jgi:hypothetical protein
MSFASDLERGYGNGRSFGGGQGGNGGNNSNGGGYQSGGFGYGGSNPDDEYNHEKTQVSTNIRTMAAYFQQIIDSSSALGTERDSAEFRENTYVLDLHFSQNFNVCAPKRVWRLRGNFSLPQRNFRVSPRDLPAAQPAAVFYDPGST